MAGAKALWTVDQLVEWTSVLKEIQTVEKWVVALVE